MKDAQARATPTCPITRKYWDDPIPNLFLTLFTSSIHSVP